MPAKGLIFSLEVTPPAPAKAGSGGSHLSALAVVLAGPVEGADPQTEGDSEASSPQIEVEFQNQSGALFPADDNSPVTQFFAADTAFDCGQGGSEDWALSGN
jgi:hypothetical protein